MLTVMIVDDSQDVFGEKDEVCELQYIYFFSLMFPSIAFHDSTSKTSIRSWPTTTTTSSIHATNRSDTQPSSGKHGRDRVADSERPKYL